MEDFLAAAREKIQAAKAHECHRVEVTMREAIDILAPCLDSGHGRRSGSERRAYNAFARFALLHVAPNWLSAFSAKAMELSFSSLFVRAAQPPRLCAFFALCDCVSPALLGADGEGSVSDESGDRNKNSRRARRGRGEAVVAMAALRDSRAATRTCVAGLLRRMLLPISSAGARESGLAALFLEAATASATGTAGDGMISCAGAQLDQDLLLKYLGALPARILALDPGATGHSSEHAHDALALFQHDRFGRLACEHLLRAAILSTVLDDKALPPVSLPEHGSNGGGTLSVHVAVRSRLAPCEFFARAAAKLAALGHLRAFACAWAWILVREELCATLHARRGTSASTAASSLRHLLQQRCRRHRVLFNALPTALVAPLMQELMAATEQLEESRSQGSIRQTPNCTGVVAVAMQSLSVGVLMRVAGERLSNLVAAGSRPSVFDMEASVNASCLLLRKRKGSDNSDAPTARSMARAWSPVSIARAVALFVVANSGGNTENAAASANARILLPLARELATLWTAMGRAGVAVPTSSNASIIDNTRASAGLFPADYLLHVSTTNALLCCMSELGADEIGGELLGSILDGVQAHLQNSLLQVRVLGMAVAKAFSEAIKGNDQVEEEEKGSDEADASELYFEELHGVLIGENEIASEGLESLGLVRGRTVVSADSLCAPPSFKWWGQARVIRERREHFFCGVSCAALRLAFKSLGPTSLPILQAECDAELVEHANDCVLSEPIDRDCRGDEGVSTADNAHGEDEDVANDDICEAQFLEKQHTRITASGGAQPAVRVVGFDVPEFSGFDPCAELESDGDDSDVSISDSASASEGDSDDESSADSFVDSASDENDDAVQTEALDDDDAQVDLNPAPAPRYLRDLLHDLTARELHDPGHSQHGGVTADRSSSSGEAATALDRFESALEAAAALVRRRPRDLDELAPSLVTTILHLQDYAAKGDAFDTPRRAALRALVFTAPDTAVLPLAAEVFATGRTTTSRIEAVATLIAAALELADIQFDKSTSASERSGAHDSLASAVPPEMAVERDAHITAAERSPPRTRRFASARPPPPKSAANKFAPHAPLFFFSLFQPIAQRNAGKCKPESGPRGSNDKLPYAAAYDYEGEQGRWSDTFSFVRERALAPKGVSERVEMSAVDMWGRDSAVLARVLTALGAFAHCAGAAAPTVAPLLAALLPFLSEEHVHAHPDPAVRCAALTALTHALLLGAGASDAGAGAAVALVALRDFTEAHRKKANVLLSWTKRASTHDSDAGCREAAMTICATGLLRMIS